MFAAEARLPGTLACPVCTAHQCQHVSLPAEHVSSGQTMLHSCHDACAMPCNYRSASCHMTLSPSIADTSNSPALLKLLLTVDDGYLACPLHLAQTECAHSWGCHALCSPTAESAHAGQSMLCFQQAGNATDAALVGISNAHEVL